MYTRTLIRHRRSREVDAAVPKNIAPVRFLALRGFSAHQLAYTLDSLVRVSRRADEAPSASIRQTQIPRTDLEERLGFPLSVPSHKPGNNPDPCPTGQTHADQRPVYAGNNQCNRVPGRTRGDIISSLSTISSTFHSLFKVLFIFPSRYLFAIGLPSVFSLRWDLPPALG